MKVKLLYFAGARDLTSRAYESLEIPDGTSVAALSQKLMAVHPGLAKLKSSIRFSINLDVADGGEILREGDEVGVLPPVAGG